MIVFESQNIELEYHQSENILEVRWVGELEIEQFKLLWHKVIEAANNYEVENILLDASHVGAKSTLAIYTPQFQYYFSQPPILPTVKKMARVASAYPEYDQDMTNLYFTSNQPSRSFEFKNFQHHYEALAWLTGIY